MKTDIQKTQHFSTNEQLIKNLLDFIPINAELIEPFAGSGDLMNFFPTHTWQAYDIQPQDSNIVLLDTLKYPPDYNHKWVITNPPYLAKNKATDLSIFQLYPNYDDLYKIAISTILSADGGILIIPINFFADERSGKIRQDFFNNFKILQLNIFTNQMFKDTTYNVCSFVFVRQTGLSEISIPTTIFRNNNIV